ncbi:FKBP-type peptidylprolyl isomerase [Flavobacterium piscis]|uniref:Peptidylprolyl isomerase n=1 Tax=Flavobacterium piscis TaxID=1114874 RepID=A0ABU1YEN0_9FLAO|nr:FKBP-type peptidylprolyl isomerase [Flavobacterium piscis]MDR7212702.1 hypothetical protein [Flavobacterium piscis]
MNKFKYFFILLIALTGFVSCNKDDDNDVKIEPLRDYAEQYATDKATIESYLNTHYIVVTESAGNMEDMDVVIDSIENPATQVPIMSYKANVGTAVFPQLKSKNVDLHGITYELYYLVLREGTGESPLNTDGVLASYSGSYLSDVAKTDKNPEYISTTFFEQVKYPQDFADLTRLVRGWGETFPEFKTGAVVGNDNGTINYTDFGAGVMFLPSGLGYYSGGGSIPAYKPLVFSFKLYQIQRLDHDADGVLDFNEDINGDGYVYDFRNTTLYPNAPVNPDDTDGDGIPDFLDVDDDGDGYTTRLEITKAANEFGVVNGINYGPSRYFPFEAFVVEDDPLTPNVDESLNSEFRGIPAFVKTETVDGVTKNVYDYTTHGRLKIHLDKAHNTLR